MAIIPSIIPGGSRLTNAITNFLEGGQLGIDSIRRVDYSSSYLWVADFDVDKQTGISLPTPFDSFFPASEVNMDIGTSNSLSIDVAQGALHFPTNTSLKSLDVTFFDDDSRTLQKWMSDWINIDIQNHGYFMSGLKDTHSIVSFKDQNSKGNDSFDRSRIVYPLRKVRLSLLDRSKSSVVTYYLEVYPDGPLTFAGSQSSEAETFNMKFNIYTMLKQEAGGRSTFDNIKRIIGQTIGRFI